MGVGVGSYFCADSTCVPARASIFSDVVAPSDTFSNSLRAALELLVRKSSSTGVSCSNIQIEYSVTGGGKRKLQQDGMHVILAWYLLKNLIMGTVHTV